MTRVGALLLVSCIGCKAILGLDGYTDVEPAGAGGGGAGGSGGATSFVAWSQRLGEGGITSATSVAVNGDGSIVVVGMFDTSMTWGRTTMTVDTACVFVGKLAADGTPLWAKSFNMGGDAKPTVAVTESRVFVAGAIHMVTDLGTGVLPHAGLADVVVLMLSQDGTLMGAGAWGTAGEDFAADIVTTPNANAVVCGAFGEGTSEGAIDFGSGAIAVSPNAVSNTFVVELDQTLFPAWTETTALVEPATSRCRGAAMGPQGVVLSGRLNGSVNFDGIERSSGAADDFYVWSIDGNGSGRWVDDYGSTSSQEAPNIAIDADGNPVIAGRLFGEVSLDGAAGTIGSTAASLFIATLADTTGDGADALVLGPAEGDLAVAADSSGDIFVAGGFLGALVGRDGNPIDSMESAEDVVIARMHRGTNALALDWLFTGGDGEKQEALDVALSSEQVVVVGAMEGTLALGDVELVSDSTRHGFIVSLTRSALEP